MRSHALVALSLFLGLSLLAPALTAEAQNDAEQQLQAARELIFQARFEDAIGAARTFLNRPDLNAYDRNGGLEVLAIAQVANRQREDAEQTLQLLYSRDPGHRLSDPDASPPVISAFARARESHPDTVPVRLEHAPPTLTVRAAPEIRVQISEGADAVNEMQLVYRIGGEGAARVVMTAREDGSYTARIPVVGEATSATDVAYFIRALAPSLAPLGHVGTEAEPLQLRIPAEVADIENERPPALEPIIAPEPEEEGGGSVIEEWWFWVIIVAVVGGGVTAGILLGTQQSAQEGTLGSAQLMQIEW